MNHHRYEPHAGSLAARVLAYFRQQPDEQLSAGDIAIKYDTNINEVPALLASAVTHQLLSVQSTRKAGVPSKVYSAGPALTAHPAPAQAPAGTAATKPKRASRIGQRLPQLDISTLQVAVGQPMPARRSRTGESRWDPLFAKLTAPDQSVDVPVVYSAAIAKARTLWLKTHPGQKIAIARLPDGQQCRVKRTA